MVHILTASNRSSSPLPSMARPQKRKQLRADDSPSNLNPSETVKSTAAYPYPPATETQASLADALLRRPRTPNTTKSSEVVPCLSPSQNRKRRRDDSQNDQLIPKKSKTSDFSPDFYDSLSRTWLTRRALRELERRNKNSAPSKPGPTPQTPQRSKLAAFARLGGPDLSDIRGVCLRP